MLIHLKSQASPPNPTIVLCPGIHGTQLTEQCLEELNFFNADVVVFPVESYPAYSAWHLIQFLESELSVTHGSQSHPILLIAFSAGVVAAIATAWYWHMKGRSVAALIAIDGWGVPLYGSFPIHRISHDVFTHVTSTLGERLGDCFYANPPVEHLDMWRSPTAVEGRWVYSGSGLGLLHRLPIVRLSTQTTAATFMQMLLHRYQSETRET